MYALVRKIKKKNVSKTFLVTWVLSKSHIDSKKKKKEIQSIEKNIIPKARFKFKITFLFRISHLFAFPWSQNSTEVLYFSDKYFSVVQIGSNPVQSKQ